MVELRSNSARMHSTSVSVVLELKILLGRELFEYKS